MTIPKKNPVLDRLLRVMWSGGDSIALGPMLAVGALAWGAFSAAYLLVKGVILDEVLVPAEIIAGAVQYPPEGILTRFSTCRRMLCSITWQRLYGQRCQAPGSSRPSAISCFSFLSMFVPFALTLLLTRRPFWGYVASSLTASEAVLRFAGVYPLWVFPGAYSTGHISIHLAVLIVVLLLAGLWRFGGFLLGLLVSLHPAMAIVVWP